METLKNLKITLTLLKISAFCLLVFILHWIFSDTEYTIAVMDNIPLVYVFHPYLYLNKKVIALILPILFNLALWRPDCKSYAFIRAVLYVELIKVIATMLFSFLGMLSIFWGVELSEGYLSAKLSIIYFCFLVYILIRINSIKYQHFFCGNNESKVIKKRKIIVMLGFLFLLLSLESVVQYINPFPAFNVKDYYLEGHRLADDGYIGYFKTLELSHNKKFFANTFMLGNNRDGVGIFYTKNGEKIKSIGFNGMQKCAFTPDDESILIRRKNANEIVFETWNIESGTRKKFFLVPQNLLNTEKKKKFFVNKVYFSPSGKYFAAMGSGIELWNYEEEKLTAFYEAGKHIESLAWLSDQGYLVIQMGAEFEKETEKFVCWDEIGLDGKVIRHKKEEMTKDFREKINGLRETNVAIKTGNQEKYAAIVISGIPKKVIWYRKGYVDIWNVEKEEKVFSLASNYRILNVDYHPDGKHLLVLEQLRDNRGRIKIWNLETKECEKVVYIPKSRFSTDIAYIDDGKKAIQIRNPISIIDLT